MDAVGERAKGKPLLSCLLCGSRFSIRDVEEGNYVAETGICKDCYQLMKNSSESCFGKQTKGRKLGYDANAIACQEFCPDRKECQKWVGEENAV